ncbi:Uncharacterised protein [Mycobacteroides abscessus subsp. abscessus]|nr:Uncharacterised protein [Mycobacteroides abscessus subsp. abscessus]
MRLSDRRHRRAAPPQHSRYPRTRQLPGRRRAHRAVGRLGAFGRQACCRDWNGLHWCASGFGDAARCRAGDLIHPDPAVGAVGAHVVAAAEVRGQAPGCVAHPTHRALHGPDGHGCFGQHCDPARLGTAFGAAVRACLPTSDPRQGAEAEAHPGLRAAVQASSAVRFVPSCCTEAERRDCHRPHQQDHSDGDRDGGWHRARIRRDRPGHRVPGAQLHAPHESGWQGWVFD